MRISNVKLGIAMPNNFPFVPAAFFDSFIMMEKPDFVYIRSGVHHDLAGLRNGIVESALEMGCTHLFMADVDQTYERDTIPRLLSHNKDIVGGIICRRYMPFDPLLFKGDIGCYEPIENWQEGDLVEVDATGTGCLLYNMDVFRKLPAPWFQFGGTKDDPIGEDFYFCSEARKAGFQIFVDTGCKIGHLSWMVVTTDTWRLVTAVEKMKAEQAA